MGIKEDIIAAIQAAADATEDPNTKLSMGSPGEHIDPGTGESLETGQAWANPKKVWPVVAEGLATILGNASKIRRITENDTLLETDYLIEHAGTLKTLTLPAPDADNQGFYIIKALANGVLVDGTIDGAAGPHGFNIYDVVRIYSNGNPSDGWLTW